MYTKIKYKYNDTRNCRERDLTNGKMAYFMLISCFCDLDLLMVIRGILSFFPNSAVLWKIFLKVKN